MRKFIMLTQAICLLATALSYGQAKLDPDSTKAGGSKTLPNVQWSRKLVNGKAVYYLYDADLNKTYPFYTAQYANSILVGKQEAAGTYALKSDLSSVVPYTGATGNLNIGYHGLAAQLIQAYGPTSNTLGRGTFFLLQDYGTGSANAEQGFQISGPGHGDLVQFSRVSSNPYRENWRTSNATGITKFAFSPQIPVTSALIKTDANGNLVAAIPGTDYALSSSNPLGITTSGISGPATLVGNTLNIPTPTAIGIGAQPSENQRLSTSDSPTFRAIGIGTSSPNTTLDVRGQIMSGGQDSNLDPNAPTGNLSFLQGSGRMLMGWNRTGFQAEADFIANRLDHSKPDAALTKGGFAFYDLDDFGKQNQLMRINGDDGNVGIGLEYPDSKLTVNGTVHAKEVLVNLTNFPDYVFDSGYKLPELTAVKHFITENHHLPDMPSASEVETKGLKIGEAQTLLTKKIEELTLYLIEKDRQLNVQNLRLLKLENLAKRRKSAAGNH